MKKHNVKVSGKEYSMIYVDKKVTFWGLQIGRKGEMILTRAHNVGLVGQITYVGLIL